MTGHGKTYSRKSIFQTLTPFFASPLHLSIHSFITHVLGLHNVARFSVRPWGVTMIKMGRGQSMPNYSQDREAENYVSITKCV